MKRKAQRRRSGAAAPAPDLRVVEGGASAAASVPLPPTEAEKIAERRELIDRHRGQRSDLIARQAREVAELVTRHADEEKQLADAQATDVARMWRRHGREQAGASMRLLDGVVGYRGKQPA